MYLKEFEKLKKSINCSSQLTTGYDKLTCPKSLNQLGTEWTQGRWKYFWSGLSERILELMYNVEIELEEDLEHLSEYDDIKSHKSPLFVNSAYSQKENSFGVRTIFPPSWKNKLPNTNTLQHILCDRKKKSLQLLENDMDADLDESDDDQNTYINKGWPPTYPIAWVNDVNRDGFPKNFTYVKAMQFSKKTLPLLDPAFLVDCNCPSGKCGSRCKCRQDSILKYVEKEGPPELENLGMESGEEHIVECNVQCSCSATCGNRIVQRHDKSPFVSLQLFHTKNRGWGIRAMQSIPPKRYVSQYIGNVIKENENSSGKYIWSQHETTSGLAIDATFYGNLSRFINHSCVPNLLAVPVLVESSDRTSGFCRIAFFTKRLIEKNEELTIHYNYEIDPNVDGVPCLCGEEECQGRLY